MDRNQIVKLTKTPISESFYKVINRLEQGHSVDMSIIEQVPEIQLADMCLENSGTDTMLLNQNTRKIMQEGILRHLNSLGSYNGVDVDENGIKTPVYNGFVERGRQVHFVLGLPASGKSSALADVVSKEFHARFIDADMVKESIPEFNNGWGATTVHNESRMIMQQSYEDALALGQNVVIQRIGEPPESILEQMKTAKQAGCTVNIHYMDLEPNKALGRMLGRFVYTGRYMGPRIMERYLGKDGENKMRDAYETLRDSEYCDGYSEWTNDVAFGENAILVDYGGITGKFLDDARHDIESKLGTKEEDPFISDSEQHDILLSVREDEINLVKNIRNNAETRIKILTDVQKQGREFQERMMKAYVDSRNHVLDNKTPERPNYEAMKRQIERENTNADDPSVKALEEHTESLPGDFSK